MRAAEPGILFGKQIGFEERLMEGESCGRFDIVIAM
jgi:hypothetical protein